MNLNLCFDLSQIYDRLKYYKEFDFLNYLNFLVQQIPNPINLYLYATIVHNMFILRNILFLISKFIYNISDKKNLNVSNLLDFIEINIFNINKKYINEKDRFIPLNRVFNNFLNDNLNSSNIVYFTGFKNLDKILNGLHKGDLIILAGRPSMGKTTFSLNIAQKISNKYNFPIVIFSMEMSSIQLLIKILSSTLDKDQTDLISDLNDRNLKVNKLLFEKINSMNIFIDESSTLTVSKIYSKCKFLMKEHGDIGLIIIDYLQLMSSSLINNQNRVFEVSEISRSLKCLAKEFNVPIIAISQLNRNLESRSNKRPIMSDLRESGSIEQDADVVLFIYRDFIYNNKNKNINLTEIIVGKNRKGPTGKAFFNFYDSISKFNDSF